MTGNVISSCEEMSAIHYPVTLVRDVCGVCESSPSDGTVVGDSGPPLLDVIDIPVVGDPLSEPQITQVNGKGRRCYCRRVQSHAPTAGFVGGRLPTSTLRRTPDLFLRRARGSIRSECHWVGQAII